MCRLLKISSGSSKIISGQVEIMIKLVMTAADGFNFKYDSSIRHIKYLLLDKKTENVMNILDDAADKI
jgi:hypothetical protein